MFADNGVHPGLILGTSFVLKEKEKSRKYLFKSLQKKKLNQLKIIQYLIDGDIGFYNHPNNHLGIFVGLGLSRMQTYTTKMRTMGLSLKLNYLRRFYNIPTLQLNENGTITKIKGAGTNSFVVAIAPSFGKIVGFNKGKRKWHFYIKPNFQIIKYDFGFFPNAAIEIGATANFIKKALPKK